MHTETMVACYFLGALQIAYNEMCVYQGHMFVQYVSAKNNDTYSDPGFIFSVILN